jgi:hypothetical protein
MNPWDAELSPHRRRVNEFAKPQSTGEGRVGRYFPGDRAGRRSGVADLVDLVGCSGGAPANVMQDVAVPPT